MPAVSAWAQSLLAGDKIPDLTWTISEETGEIVATVTQRDAIIHEAKMWYALPDTHCIALHCTRIIDPCTPRYGYSCGQNSWDGDKKRRDFRVANLDYPCTCGIYAEGTCANLKSVLRQQVRLRAAQVIRAYNENVYVCMCRC